MAPDGTDELPRIPELEQEYELVRELGRGGTAVVYLARDRQLGRDVAIKLIRPSHLKDEDALARLLREARTVGKLQHPNIVMLLGTRRLEGGGLALVLQYVPGRTLKERIRAEGPLPFSHVEGILRDLGRALAYAHRRRIVHRDIKPENVYLDDDAGVARLADFGIARAWDSDSGLTLPGTAIGTPTYMSPEQVDGYDLDGRSDLYSLGLLGWEMLTGRQPWDGESLYNVIYKQKHEPLPAAGVLRSGIPHHLARVVAGALPKEPDERWPSAEAFLEALDGKSAPPHASHGRAKAPDFFDWTDHAPGPAAKEVAPDPSTTRGPASRDGPTPDAPTAPPRPSDTPDRPAPADEPHPDREQALEQLRLAQRAQASDRPRDEAEENRPPRRRWIAAAAVLLLGGAATYAALFAAPGGSLIPFLPGADDRAGEAFDPALEAPGLHPDILSGQAAPGPSAEGPGAADPGAEAPAPNPGSIENARLLTAISGEAQEALTGTPLDQPVRVRVEDEEGLPVAGAPVAFSGPGSVAPAEALTDGAGVASAVWTLGAEPGLQELSAAVPGADAPPVTLAATGLPRTPTRIEIVTGASQEGTPGDPLPRPLTIRLLDAAGVGVARHWVHVSLPEGAGSVEADSARTDLQGFAQFTWTLGAGEGTHELRVRASGDDDAPAATLVAEAVAPRLPVRSGVVAGGTHTCRLEPSGALSCWGDNARGQLGADGAARRASPGPDLAEGPFARAAAGLSHTCGVAPDGAAYCWGSNDSGQLGDGSGTHRSAPTPVDGDIRFAEIRAGAAHTCGLARDGRVFCWGANDQGQLGDGSTQSRNAPVEVAGGRRFQSIALGWRHSCALAFDGTAHCWGSNASGALGVEGTGAAPMPRPVAGGRTFTSLAAGNAHTCGLSGDGTLLCWGENSGGQLGDGTTVSRAEPRPVDDARTFVAVAAGALHTCAIAQGGAAYCWGRNVYGQVGDGSTSDRTVPAAVEGSYRFSRLEAFGSHTCGSTPGGAVLCWGYSADGQVGDGSRENRSAPVRVPG